MDLFYLQQLYKLHPVSQDYYQWLCYQWIPHSLCVLHYRYSLHTTHYTLHTTQPQCHQANDWAYIIYTTIQSRPNSPIDEFNLKKSTSPGHRLNSLKPRHDSLAITYHRCSDFCPYGLHESTFRNLMHWCCSIHHASTHKKISPVAEAKQTHVFDQFGVCILKNNCGMWLKLYLWSLDIYFSLSLNYIPR